MKKVIEGLEDFLTAWILTFKQQIKSEKTGTEKLKGKLEMAQRTLKVLKNLKEIV